MRAMMTTNLAELFDAYSLRARLYPAFLVVLPITALVHLLLDLRGVERIWPLFVSAGGMFFLANFVRSRGLQVQDRLVAQWGGLPTTTALRWRSSGNSVLRDRRRNRLEDVTGVRLPTRMEEAADPSAADDHYETAVRSLIARVRERRNAFPRVYEEVTHYGFRRNLYALKPHALVLLAIALVMCAIAELGDVSPTSLAVSMSINGLALLAWATVIIPSWVLQAGTRYAERLFDALEDDSLL
jgi:hypothetical protein